MKPTGEQWQTARVVSHHPWPGADGLATIEIDAEVAPRRPGQYARLACRGDDDAWGVRYLSIASAPGQPAEFLVAPSTEDTEPGDPAALRPGDEVMVSRVGDGRLIVDGLAPAPTLWLLAAGTGLAPLLSIIRADATEGFDRVVLVHATRRPALLAYARELDQWATAAAHRHYVPMLSREARAGILDGRIPAALADNRLQDVAGAAVLPEDAAMICGGGAMVADTRDMLATLGLLGHRVRTEF